MITFSTYLQEKLIISRDVKTSVFRINVIKQIIEKFVQNYTDSYEEDILGNEPCLRITIKLDKAKSLDENNDICKKIRQEIHNTTKYTWDSTSTETKVIKITIKLK